LAHAHEKGAAHGGLSPAAVFVVRTAGTPLVKVLNVGLRKLALFAAKTGDLNAAAAAAEYLAPEQLTGPGRADPACDLYALGCTLYFLLTGHPPRPATGDSLLHQLVDVVPVERLRPDVPPALAEIVRVLMAKDPAGRPRSMAEVAAWLAPFSETGAGSSNVEFSLPPPAPADSSPFAGLDDDGPFQTTLGEGDATPISIRVPRRLTTGGGSITMVGLLLLAAAIIAGVGVAVAMVLRSVGK
jgi:serine/threonine protein kinase